MSEIFTNVNWVEIILGFLLGLTPSIFKLTKNIYRFFTEKSRLIGTYHYYHLSGTRYNEIKKKTLVISRSFKGYLKAEIPLSDHTGLSFEGRVTNSELSIRYIELHGENNLEKAFLIINLPVNRNFAVLTGVLGALNLRNIPFCGKIVLSRELLSDDVVHGIIGSHNLYAELITGSDFQNPPAAPSPTTPQHDIAQ